MSKESKRDQEPRKGINPETGKPYKPVKRKAWDALLKRAATRKARGDA